MNYSRVLHHKNRQPETFFSQPKPLHAGRARKMARCDGFSLVLLTHVEGDKVLICSLTTWKFSSTHRSINHSPLLHSQAEQIDFLLSPSLSASQFPSTCVLAKLPFCLLWSEALLLSPTLRLVCLVCPRHAFKWLTKRPSWRRSHARRRDFLSRLSTE